MEDGVIWFESRLCDQQLTDGGCYVNAKRRSIKREDFLKNWELYLNFPKIFECHPGELPANDPNGEEGKYTFLCMENGIFVPTKEWDLVKRVQEGKMSVNLQIKIWSETMWETQLQCPLLFPEELREYCKTMPEWVYKSTIEQTKKRVIKDIGFIPTWLNNS